MSKRSKQKNAIAVCSFEISKAKSEVQIFPAGFFRATDGRPFEVAHWYLDAVIAARLIEQFHAKQTPFIIDYEHQTLNAEKNGQPAPRAASMSRFEWREGIGLFAVDVQWTKRAMKYIDDDEYGFISPVFPYDRTTGEVTGLFHCGLVNDPGLDGMAAVNELAAAKYGQTTPANTKEDTLMNEALLIMLGLEKDATEDQIKNAVEALKAKAGSVDTLTGEVATLTDQVAALKANGDDGKGNPDPSKFVPVGVVKNLQTQVAALSAKINSNEVNDIIDVAMSEGKLLPALESWARDLGNKDVAALKSFIENAPAVAALSGNQTDGKNFGGGAVNHGLSVEQLAICKNLGMEPEDMAKELAAQV